ncbi:MAG: MotA/TolQ/ExbB proton channel family protein [Elusimicrobiota bacterium]
MGSYNVGLRDLIAAGGFTLSVLALLSIYTSAVIWERWRYYRKNLSGLDDLLRQLRAQIEKGDLHDATKTCKRYPGAGAKVVLACLVGPAEKKERHGATDRALERQTAELERRLPALGTIGSTAPFIGLFGTVLGVMRAFRDLATAASAGPGVVAIGISEALVATAAGLFVAVPAIIAYNYFTTRANHFADELRWITDELLDRLTKRT